MSHDTEATRPLRADAQRNRRRILDAAAELFAERGLEASLDQIAERAGVGVGTVYRRFPDKDTLIDELFESRIAEFVTVAEECAAMEDPWVGLTTFIAEGSIFQGKNSALRQLMHGPGLSRKLMSVPRTKLSPLVGSMVERARESGQLRDDFEVLDVPLIEMMLAHVIDITGEVAPETWTRFLTMVIDGMRSDAPTPLPAPGITYPQYIDALTKKTT